MAPHGLILCEDGATPNSDHLEAFVLLCLYILTDIWAKKSDSWGSWMVTQAARAGTLGVAGLSEFLGVFVLFL